MNNGSHWGPVKLAEGLCLGLYGNEHYVLLDVGYASAEWRITLPIGQGSMVAIFDGV